MKDQSIYTNKLIAHRGYHNLSNGIPENSLEAFKRAIIFNYHIELDIVMLKDKNIVVFHDKNLKRACNINKNIEDLTYEEIKDLKLFKTKSKIPLLKEVLDLDFSNTVLFIDLKYNIDKKELMKILSNYNIKYVILSFLLKDLIWFKKNKYDLKKGLLLTNLDFRGSIPKFMSLIKPDFLVCNVNMFEKETIKKYQKSIPIIGWTIKNKTSYLKYKNYYNNLICENMNTF